MCKIKQFLFQNLTFDLIEIPVFVLMAVIGKKRLYTYGFWNKEMLFLIHLYSHSLI